MFQRQHVQPEAASAEGFQRQLRLLLADRSSPESAALFQLLLKYIHRRVVNVSRTCGGALGDSQQEEVASEVLLQLMQGALARFRGETMGELYAFVRTIADRSAWRTIRRIERERNLLSGAGAEIVEEWNAPAVRPDKHLELVPDSPLSENDQQYLRDLLEAGSKAELARKAGVSRAAVTQRVQRIRARVAELAPGERMAHEVWMHQAAHRALELEDASFSERVEPQ